jgi:hypothetical protein
MRWQDFAFGRFAPEWLKTKHIRRAPLDGLLHCALQTVYTSITQLLVRRRVFERVGLFESRWGAMSDFEWGMRVGLLEDCVFLPDKLAAWRVHGQQATGETESIATRRKMLAMSRVAFARATEVSSQLLARLETAPFLQFYQQQIVDFGLRQAQTRKGKMKFLARESLQSGVLVLREVWSRLRNRPFEESVQFRVLEMLLQRNQVPSPTFL